MEQKIIGSKKSTFVFIKGLVFSFLKHKLAFLTFSFPCEDIFPLLNNQTVSKIKTEKKGQILKKGISNTFSMSWEESAAEGVAEAKENTEEAIWKSNNKNVSQMSSRLKPKLQQMWIWEGERRWVGLCSKGVSSHFRTILRNEGAMSSKRKLVVIKIQNWVYLLFMKVKK